MDSTLPKDPFGSDLPVPQFEPTPDFIPTQNDVVVAPPTPAPLETPPTLSPATTPTRLSPAAPRESRSPTPIIFTVLGGGLLVATASTAFLWIQNQSLKQQLATIQAVEAGRELPPTPTPSVSQTPTATPTTTALLTAFTRIDDVIKRAQQEASTAQLLMITSDNIGTTPESSPSTLNTTGTIYKYWFRKAPGTTSYFYVQAAERGDLNVVAPATVSPDNNIPDLVSYRKNNQLGLDADQAHTLIWTQLLNDYTQGNRPTGITAKYLRSVPSNPSINTPVNLWQLVYKFDPSAGIKDIVVQVNANTKQVIYSNLPKNITTPTASPAANPQ